MSRFAYVVKDELIPGKMSIFQKDTLKPRGIFELVAQLPKNVADDSKEPDVAFVQVTDPVRKQDIRDFVKSFSF